MPAAAIAIVPARTADAAALTALARAAKASWAYPAAWLAQWRDELTITPADIERRPTWKAVDAGDLVAMYVLERAGDHWSLEHLWVRPDRQGTGLGRALVEHARRTAQELGPAPIEILSDPHAEPFYRRLGAVRVGAEPAPMPGAPDRVLPKLRLEPGT